MDFDDVQRLRAEYKQAAGLYLKRFGWRETCNTPGSLWLWMRDFPEFGGVILVNEETAMDMTHRILDSDGT